MVGWAAFWDPFSHLIALDFPYLVNMVAQNIWWIFMMYAFAYFFYDKKNTLRNFLLVALSMWLFFDFAKMMGWGVFVGLYLVLAYISRMSALMFAENTKSLKAKLPLIYIVLAFSVFIYFNVFMGGA